MSKEEKLNINIILTDKSGWVVRYDLVTPPKRTLFRRVLNFFKRLWNFIKP